MGDNCPICYETFSNLRDDSCSARKLDCGDIICYQCISSEIADNTFYCPECGREYHGSVVDDFSIYYDKNDNNDNNDNKIKKVVSFDMDDIDPLQIATQDPTPISNSMRTSSGRRNSLRFPCTFPNCNKLAIAMGVCLEHTGFSATKENKYVSQMENKKDLTDISIKSGGIFGTRNSQSDTISPSDIIKRFQSQKRLELGEVMEILNRAKNLLSREPNILRLDAPVMAVGDIHGQFYDLINLFEEGGYPGNESTTTYLFLGDYVDRGSFSCEVIFTLLAYKISYPDKVYLLRGNHECGSVSGHFGFKQECKRKYGVNVYHRALLVFQTMPIAAVISTAFGELYACHGGLSPKLQTLEDIENIDRFIEPESNDGLLDILWSDPISEDIVDDMTDEKYEEFLNIQWKPNPTRGCSHCFGYKAIRDFLNKNGLVCIVRAHEVQESGYKRHFEPIVVESRLKSIINRRLQDMINSPRPNNDNYDTDKNLISMNDNNSSFLSSMITEKDFPPVITIFSAPNYCDRYGNKAAILHIDSALDGFRIIQYDCVEHPIPEISGSQTENYIEAITLACPYMPSSFRNFVKLAIELGPDETLVVEIESSMYDSRKPDAKDVLDEIPLVNDNSSVESSSFTDATSVSASSVSSKEDEPSSPLLSPLSGNRKRRGSLSIPVVISEPIEISHEVVSEMLNNESDVSTDIESSPVPKSYRVKVDLQLESKIISRDTPSRRDVNIRRRSLSELPSPIDLRTPKKVLNHPYFQALASDSINEIHPEALSSLIKGKRTSFADSDVLFSPSALNQTKEFQFPAHESAAISVSALKEKFEKLKDSDDFFREFSDFSPASLSNNNENLSTKRGSVRVCETDRCSKFNEIIQKFGGAGKVNLETLSRGTFKAPRRMTTGSLSTDADIKKHREELFSFQQNDHIEFQEVDINNDSFDNDEQINSFIDEQNFKKKVQRRVSSWDGRQTIPKDQGISIFSNEEIDNDENDVCESRTPFTNLSETNKLGETSEIKDNNDKEMLLNTSEIYALRLMFSLFDRSGNASIEYEDLIAYAEETDDTVGIRDADLALDILDIDGDGKIGFLDFVHFAIRLKKIHLKASKVLCS